MSNGVFYSSLLLRQLYSLMLLAIIGTPDVWLFEGLNSMIEKDFLIYSSYPEV